MADSISSILIIAGLIFGVPLFFFIALNIANVFGTFGNKVATHVEGTVLNVSRPILGSDGEVLFERANISDRFFAAVVDNLMVRWPFRILYVVLFEKPLYIVLVMFIECLVVLFYFSIYAQKNGGQTLGKKWNKIKVVDMQGDNLSLGHFIWREFLARGIAILGPLFWYRLGTLWHFTYLLALTKDRRALHDIMAGTQVIKVQ